MARTTKRSGGGAVGKPIRVANENNGLLRKTLAPWPVIDRWPTLIGSALSLQYLASVYRFAQNGYRQQFVDALDELLERDPHTQAVLGQRVLTAAAGRVELTPATVADPESDEAMRAAEIAADLQRRWNAIPGKTQAIYSLVFAALYYGAGAMESHWEAKGPEGWNVSGFGFVHSRRIAWPDQNDWSAHIWDQGAVLPMTIGLYPTENFFGLRIRDVPGKFVLHTPSLRADYPTRDGIGRVIGWWMVIKLMAIRGASQYVERFGKPWVLGYYNTGDEETGGKPRTASEEDIGAAMGVMEALGVGSLATGLLPDSVKVTLDGPGVKGSQGSINHEKLIDLCDAQISKAVRGGTLQTDAGDKGARSLGDVHAEGDVRNARFDALCLADSLHQDVIWWLCHLNYPGEEHLCPTTTVHVESVGPEELLDRAEKLAKLGARPDGADLAKRLGVKLVDPENEHAVQLAPIKPADLFALSPAAAGSSLPLTLEALATAVGVSLSPALKSALVELEPADAARLIGEFIGQATATTKAEGAEGAAEAGVVPPAGDSEGSRDPSGKTKSRKGANPEKPGAKKSGTSEVAHERSGGNPSEDEDDGAAIAAEE